MGAPSSSKDNDFTSLSVRAAAEFLAGEFDLFGKDYNEIVDVGGYGLQHDVEQSTKVAGIAGEIEADPRPPSPRNGLRDTVRIQCRLV
jgi:hypothetical protein